MNLSIIKITGCLLVSILFISCKKLVEVKPPESVLTGNNIYSNDYAAISVLTGIYATMSTGGFSFVTGLQSISIKSGLSADEFTLWSGFTNQKVVPFYKNNLSTEQQLTFWESFYRCLLQINSAIEGISSASALTPQIKQQLLGEAKFLRAFCYFYLVNIYDDVPLVINNNYEVNSSLPRSPKAQAYEQIIADLIDAKNLLSPTYLSANLLTNTIERVRPNKWSASALLARVYLYIQEWENSEIEASDVINNKSLYDTIPLSGTFLKNSKEAIWQLQPTNTGWNTEDARVFILTGNPSNSRPIYLSKFLLNGFETEDQRLKNWVKSVTTSTGTYYYPYKYQSATSGAEVTEYYMVLRLAEQYLIRAEARAQQNKLSEAQADLNIIRKRAGLLNAAPTDKPSLLAAILHERQVELFSEWGHRWLDLKRFGIVDSVMSIVAPQKGGTWEPTDQLYPLPLYDIEQNPNLEQNPGY